MTVVQLQPTVDVQTAVEAAALRVLRSGRLDWGAEVPAFEAELAEFMGLKHAVGANSGLAATKLGLLALGIGPGDEVITVPNSDIASTSAIHHVGAKAVWVDIEWDTFNMNPALIEAAITPRTKALLPVHLYGHPANMPEIMAIARRHNLLVLEDACLAVGASIAGTRTGHWGHVTAISHAPSKHVGGHGTGGSLLTNDADLAERARRFSGYGQPRERSYNRNLIGEGQLMLVEGVNERLDEIQAAMLRAKLPHVAGWIEQRRANAAAYTAALTGTTILPPTERPGYRHTYRNYLIRAANRDLVQRRLAEAGIRTMLLYVPPLHLQPVYARLGHQHGSFPVTEAACDTLIAIPVGPEVTPTERDRTIEALRSVAKELPPLPAVA